MPEGLGKWERKIYEKTPIWFQSFWVRYHVTFKQAFFVALFVAIAITGVEARNAQNDAGQASRDLKVLKTIVETPCSPKVPNGPPRNPAACSRSFRTTIQRILQAQQACEIVQKASPLLQINGKPIPRVKCVSPTTGRQVDPATGRSPKEGKEDRETSDQDSNRDQSRNPSQGGSGVGGSGGNDTGGGNVNGNNGVRSPNSPHPGSDGGGSVSNPEAGHSPEGDGSPAAQPTPSPPSSDEPSPLEPPGFVPPVVSEVAKEICKVNPVGIRICITTPR